MNYEQQIRTVQQKNHRPILEIWRRLHEQSKHNDARRVPLNPVDK